MWINNDVELYPKIYFSEFFSPSIVGREAQSCQFLRVKKEGVGAPSARPNSDVQGAWLAIVSMHVAEMLIGPKKKRLIELDFSLESTRSPNP